MEKLNKLPKRILSDITTSERRISQTQRVVNTNKEDTLFHGRRKLDSHADTTVAGKNYFILCYTYRIYDVAPLSDKYTPMKDVPIVSAATGYTSANGRNYILVLNEELYIKRDATHPDQSKSMPTFWGQR